MFSDIGTEKLIVVATGALLVGVHVAVRAFWWVRVLIDDHRSS